MSMIAIGGLFDNMVDGLVNYYIENGNAILALLLTIVSELLIFFIIIIRRIPKNEIKLWVIFIIGLNCLTNPPAQLFYSTNVLNLGLTANFILTETLVIIVEALLIYMVMLRVFSGAFFYSILLNGSSILIGELLCVMRITPWC